MLRKLVITRKKEIRLGWSYRAFDFELELDGVLIGRIRDGETVSFPVSEREQLLEVRVRNGRGKPNWCAIVPAGTEDCGVIVSPYTHQEPTVGLISAAASETNGGMHSR